MKEERASEYCKLYSMIMNGMKHYYIGCMGENGFIRICVGTDEEEAINEFERTENYAEKHGGTIILNVIGETRKKNYAMNERIGKYYKIYSMNVGGFTDYYVSKINNDDFLIGIYETFAEALNMFEIAEKYAESKMDGEKNETN